MVYQVNFYRSVPPDAPLKVRQMAEKVEPYIPQAVEGLRLAIPRLSTHIATIAASRTFDRVKRACEEGAIEVQKSSYYSDLKECSDYEVHITYENYISRCGLRINCFGGGIRACYIRCAKPYSQARTEYHKLKEDKPLDLYFYGYYEEGAPRMWSWIIYDPIKLVDSGAIEIVNSPGRMENWGDSLSAKIFHYEMEDCILFRSDMLNPQEENWF